MRFKTSAEERREQAITRLVDEPPSDAERARMGAWANDADVRREVASQQRVAHALRTGGPAVPEHLLTAVEGRVQAAYGRKKQGPRPSWTALATGRRPAVALAGLVALAAVIAVVVVAVGGNAGSGIGTAARLAFAPSTGPAPAAQSAKLLDVSYAGITYPNYAEFSAQPTGRRTDRISGRSTLTVFYRLADGARLSYTVFSGRPVPLPRAAREVVYEGVRLHVYSMADGLSVVTLVRFGRTCVLAASTSRNQVLALAAAPVRAQATV